MRVQLSLLGRDFVELGRARGFREIVVLQFDGVSRDQQGGRLCRNGPRVAAAPATEIYSAHVKQRMKRIPAFVLLFVCFLAGCASSSSRLVAPSRPAIDPAQVQIYRTPPRHYQEIAVLDATSGAKFYHGSPQGEAEALQRLKEEAAKVGANGVLVTLVGDRSRGVLGVGVAGGGVSSGSRSFVAGGGSVGGGAPVVQNAAQGIAICVFDQR